MAKITSSLPGAIPGFLFKIGVEGFNGIGQASKIDGLDVTTDVLTYRGGAEGNTLRKQRGLTTYGDITIERFYTDSIAAWAWLGVVFEPTAGLANLASPIYKTNLVITLMDHDGSERVKFFLRNAWVKSYQISNLDANTSGYSIEKLIIAYEGLSKLGIDIT